jgi:hypothetical protein
MDRPVNTTQSLRKLEVISTLYLFIDRKVNEVICSITRLLMTTIGLSDIQFSAMNATKKFFSSTMD